MLIYMTNFINSPMSKIFPKGLPFKKILGIQSSLRASFYAFITNKPWVSFFVLIGLLFAIVFIGYTLRAPQAVSEDAPLPAKKVALFSSEKDSLLLSIPAQVKKNSVLRITALVPGIVTNILVSPGQKVTPGQTLFTLTNDYGSGATALEKSIAQNNAALAENTAALDKKIQALEEKRIKNDDTLTKSAEAVELENLKKERDTRRYTLTNSRLNLALALKNDAFLQPKSSLGGTVTSIAVRRGQLVNAGDTLATFSANDTTATLEALLPPDTAWLIDPTQKAILHLPSGDQELTLIYLSKEETVSGFYSALFSLPQTASPALIDNHYVDIQIPLQNKTDTILLPLESIYQDTHSAWVMTLQDGTAHIQTITLGSIFGNYIEVTSGIDSHTPVILTRGLVEGEAVTTE